MPPNPRLMPNSETIVRNLAERPDKVTVGNSGTSWDYSHPVYFSRPATRSSPFTATRAGGAAPIEGQRVRVPDRARPARGDDGHMTS